jgi:hypothetical protein
MKYPKKRKGISRRRFISSVVQSAVLLSAVPNVVEAASTRPKILALVYDLRLGDPQRLEALKNYKEFDVLWRDYLNGDMMPAIIEGKINDPYVNAERPIRRHGSIYQCRELLKSHGIFYLDGGKFEFGQMGDESHYKLGRRAKIERIGFFFRHGGEDGQQFEDRRFPALITTRMWIGDYVA